MNARLVLFLSLGLSLFASPASAVLMVAVDEFGGSSTLDTVTGDKGTLTFRVEQDPVSGINTLRYALSFTPVSGDVRILEPGAPAEPQYPRDFSDVLRFVGAFLFVFSEASDTDVLAPPPNVGLPANPLANNITIGETGAEGFNSASFTPSAGQPGFRAEGDANLVRFQFISDGRVPQASAMALLASGAAMCALIGWIRRRKVAL